MQKLTSGLYTFCFDRGAEGIGYSVLRDGVCLYRTAKPLLLTLKDYAGKRVPLEGAYETVELSDGKAVAVGVLTTPLGSRFRFTDTICPQDDAGAFRFERHVDISNAQEDDLGFDTQITLGVLSSDTVHDYDYFAPGSIYRKNEWAYPGSLMKRMDLDICWMRDLHFTLPFFSMQHAATGETVTFARAKHDVRVCEVFDNHYDCVTHESFDFGALGISRPGGMSMDYVFPGTEGYDEEASRYARGVYKYQFGFRQRYHPVRDDFCQDYAGYMRFGRYDGFYRVYLITGDEHYLRYTKFLEKNTRTVVDVDGTYGYSEKRRGFVDEGSGGFSYFTIMGTYAWLPWCSYVMIDPLARMYETFGCFSVVDAEKLPPAERQERNRIYRDWEFFGR